MEGTGSIREAPGLALNVQSFIAIPPLTLPFWVNAKVSPYFKIKSAALSPKFSFIPSGGYSILFVLYFPHSEVWLMVGAINIRTYRNEMCNFTL